MGGGSGGSGGRGSDAGGMTGLGIGAAVGAALFIPR